MAATLFPSNCHLPLSNTLHFPLYFNPISDLYASTLLSVKPISFRNPKPISPSKPPKSLFLCPAVTATATADANTNSNGENTIVSRNPDSSSSSKPVLVSGEAIKMPTAPWMKGPILLHPNQVLDLSKQGDNKNSTNSQPKKSSLMDKVSGGRGKKAMKKIFQGIGKLQQAHDSGETQKDPVDNAFDFPFVELEKNQNVKFGGKMPWERDERVVFRRTKKEKVVTAAELSIHKEVLERLRREAARMRKWVKVKKAGVTQAVVDQVCLIWNNNELAMLKFDLPLRRNMDRAQEIVESKTGGLVVWCKKDALVVYRGCDYVGLKTYSKTYSHGSAGGQENSLLNTCHHKLKDRVNLAEANCHVNDGEEQMSWVDGELGNIPINGSLYEREADRLLDGLGPRYIDWWRPKPLPVDADLLPEVVPGYKPPFRRCPPHARAKLKDDELTYQRKLARSLPFHFALGRNRKLQGLASAILKLWEKCHIVKIAVKWGIPNADNAQMAYELKYLTGGVLLLRNKFLIIVYRGKDFLPCRVAGLVADREMELRKCQLQEEAVRLKAIETFYVTDGLSVNSSTTGTLSEFKDIQSDSPQLVIGIRELEVQVESEKQRLEKQLRNQKRKLHILKMKIERSERELGKLNSAWMPAEEDVDQELITQEERECFRKIGLKMDSTLVLGRRGVFDGVIEGLHQHWKHKEIVKVITMQRPLSQVIYTAKQLETESGGILVSVDKMKEGHAIIIYRGKNYRRPLISIPQNLLNKRDALLRSLEMQRIGSLKFFAHLRQLSISELNSKLACLEKRRAADQREADEVE